MKVLAIGCIAIVLGLAGSGCVEKPVSRSRGAPDGFHVEFRMEADRGDYRLSTSYMGKPAVQDEPFSTTSRGFGYGPDCGRATPEYPPEYPAWITLTLRAADGAQQGPVVLVGNWTGLECNHDYAFVLKDEKFTMEAYEVHSVWTGVWPFNRHIEERRGRDLERVPP